MQSLDEDIAAVRNTVMKELNEGRDVIIHAHSWGGIPVNNVCHLVEEKLAKSLMFGGEYTQDCTYFVKSMGHVPQANHSKLRQN